MAARQHSLSGISSPLPYLPDSSVAAAGPSRTTSSISSNSSSSSAASSSRFQSDPFRAAYPRETVPSPPSSGRESHSPTAALPHPSRSSAYHPRISSSSSSSRPPTPKPYRGASTPFPLPVGQRSLGGLAALDEQMQATTLGRLSDSDSRAEPARLGTTRCYWTLLNTRGTPADPNDLTFMFCDPVLQSHMGSEKDLIIGKSFFDFVHPQERAQAKEDLRNIVASRTLFGSVTRCRYFRVPAIRETLGCANPPRDAEAHLYTSDDCYLPLDIVINMVGDSIALCFFHAVLNKTTNDNNEANKSHWTNWCGTPRELYDVEQCNRLWSLVASQDLQPSPPPNEAAASPSYVFQVLSMPEDNSFPEIIFSWPPPRLHAEEQGNDPVRDSHEAYDDGSYFADEFARLAQGVRTSPSAKTQNGQTTRNGESGTIQDGANTSCTRRFRAKHTLTTEGMVRSIESVLVPYGTVMLACFNTTYQQKMTRASIHRDLSPARAYTGMPFAPNARVVYQSAPKRNRGVGSPPGEAVSGGMPLAPDSVVTQSGEAHWPPAVTRPHPLPAGVDPRDPYSRPSEDSQRRQQSQHQLGDDAARNGPASYSKRKTASEESAQAIRSSDSVSPTSSGVALPGRDEFVTARRTGSGGQVGSPREGPDGEAEKRCTSCGTSNSPEWRKGPTGQKTLCNACGLRFSRSVSRQQKKEGKARAEQQQKEQAQRAQQAASSPDGGAVVDGDQGQPRIDGQVPSALSQHSEYFPRDSSTAYPYTQPSSSLPSYNSHYQIMSDGARDGGAPRSLYAREAADVPYVGYGHHTARRIAAMGWGTPPGQSNPTAAERDAPRSRQHAGRGSEAGGYDGQGRVDDLGGRANGRLPEGYGVNPKTPATTHRH